ncbi:MAG: right-handed parallel beta-helix repeat-containing protein, partial [Anaerolineales bacterium]|nr:right-handed parallel beta-helix repeat-containing protein [Anaerolineales bacterium]
MCNRFCNKFYRLLAFISLLLLLSLSLNFPFSTLAAGPYVVNVVSDGPDSNLGDGICYNGVDGCTLRAAIQQATADGVPTTITFSAELTGVTLAPMGVFGTLIWSGDHITLNGEGRNITLSGQNLNPGQSLLQIQGSSNTVRYLTVINARQDGIRVGDFTGVGAGNNNLIEYVTFLGNRASGVMVYGSGSGGIGNQIRYSNIGATAAATTCGSGNYDGIYITQMAIDTQITNNALVCNQRHGIWIAGAGGYPTGVIIRSNQIGTKGATAMGNAAAGILVEQASGVQIQSNTIAGNWDGIWLKGASNTVIAKNTIGVIMETTALPNENCGVLITDEAHDNRVGGTELSDRNIISGNGFSGVCLQSEAEKNIVEGNYIGTDATGDIAIPNEQMGIYIYSSPQNTIGSGTEGVVQLISGNKKNGIYIEKAKGNYIGDTNYIGVNSTLINPLKNGLAGVKLVEADNTVVTPGVVAFNGGAGVALVSG